LGGIGPEATGEFYNNLIKRMQEKKLIKSNKDYPQIIINSIPAPELIYENISSDELEPYIDGLKELDRLKLDFIVMVCNTIHLFFNDLQERIKTPIIDLRKELELYLFRKNVKVVTVLGTPNTIRKGLYKFEKIRYLNPTNKEIDKLSECINNFNIGFNRKRQIDVVKRICQKYIEKGSEIIILGCTEFAVMLKNENMPKLDTINVLVESTINKIEHLKKH
jgi:aspartate racemase